MYASRHPSFFGTVELPALFFGAIDGKAGAFVDVGSGDGRHLQYLSQLGILSQFDRVYAVDISRERIRRIRAGFPGIEACVGNAEALPLPDESMDFYFSDQVIEHVDDDQAMVREIRRVLRCDGTAFVGSVIKHSGAWYFYRKNGQWRLDPTHAREYASMKDYVGLFERCGLHVSGTFVAPIRFSLTDVLMRTMLSAGIIQGDRVRHAYERFALMRRVSRLRIAIPRYSLCYVTVRRTK